MNTGSSSLFRLTLPALLPGELLYSWCGRVHRWNGNSSALDTSTQLFGAPYSGLLHDFPVHLDTLVERTEGELGDRNTLALQHTQLGYFLPFVADDEANSILRAVSLESAPHLKYTLGIPASRVGGHHPLKGCVECIEHDEAEHGVAYWHIEHQYPSVFVCRRHRCALFVAWNPTTPVHRRDWLLPRSGPKRECLKLNVKYAENPEVLPKLGEFSESVAKLSPGSLDPQQLAWSYQASLNRQGWLTDGGNLRLDRLIRAVRIHYAGLEGLPGLRVLNTISANWAGLVGSLARKSPKPGHPLKHLLLMAMLFNTWKEFLETYRGVQNRTPEWVSRLRPREAEPPDPRIDEFVGMIREAGLSIRSAAEHVGVTTSTGVRWAKIHGIAFEKRTKTLHAPLLDIVRELLKKGGTKQEVIGKTGISAVSLNRLLSSEPTVRALWLSARYEFALTANRAQFLEVVAKHPGIPIRAIRRIAGNGYQWLYRHDRQWLIEHLPAIWRRNA